MQLVGHCGVQLAGKVQLHPVGEMSAVVNAHQGEQGLDRGDERAVRPVAGSCTRSAVAHPSPRSSWSGPPRPQ